MRIKTAYFPLLFSVYCMSTYCMEQTNFNAQQINTLFTAMSETPASFNPFSREIAHKLYQRNPAITHEDLAEFFRIPVNRRLFFVTNEHLEQFYDETILSPGIIDQIWKFIQCEQREYVIEKSQHFIETCCENNLGHTLNHFHCSYRRDLFPAAFEHEMQSSYLINAYYRFLHYGNRNYGCIDTFYETYSLIGSTIESLSYVIKYRGCSGSLSNSVALYYGNNNAMLLICHGPIITIIPKIPYIQGVTTGQQLIENIRNSTNCQQFADWRPASEMLSHLDITHY